MFPDLTKQEGAYQLPQERKSHLPHLPQLGLRWREEVTTIKHHFPTKQKIHHKRLFLIQERCEGHPLDSEPAYQSHRAANILTGAVLLARHRQNRNASCLNCTPMALWNPPLYCAVAKDLFGHHGYHTQDRFPQGCG